jgi:hypothetical protein
MQEGSEGWGEGRGYKINSNSRNIVTQSDRGATFLQIETEKSVLRGTLRTIWTIEIRDK